jgi:hypothetical protein
MAGALRQKLCRPCRLTGLESQGVDHAIVEQSRERPIAGVARRRLTVHRLSSRTSEVPLGLFRPQFRSNAVVRSSSDPARNQKGEAMETLTLILMVLGVVYTTVDAPEKARKARHYWRFVRRWLQQRRERTTKH